MATQLNAGLQALLTQLQSKNHPIESIQLVAEVALLPAGFRDHYSGQTVQSFLPVARSMKLVQKGDKGEEQTMLSTLTFGADRVVSKPKRAGLDTKDFDAHVQIDGVLATRAHSAGLRAGAGLLMRQMVDLHREITGRVNAAYEHIEVDPFVIEQILAKRFTLTMDLARLVRYIDLNDQWFELLIEGEGPEAAAQRNRISYEKLLLRDDFISEPCTLDLFMELKAEFSGNKYAIGMDFMDYYLWFRRSEEKFDPDGSFKASERDAMVKVIDAWRDTSAFGTGAQAREQIESWANRNFKIHPRHRAQVAALVDDRLGGSEGDTREHRLDDAPAPRC